MENCLQILVIFFYSFIILFQVSLKEKIIILFVSLPNTIDFILTLYFYTSELKKYFIIRIISQILIFFLFLGYYDLFREGSRDGIGNIIPIFSLLFIAILTLIFECISLKVFVENNNKISTICKVDYCFHFLFIPLMVVICIKANKRY